MVGLLDIIDDAMDVMRAMLQAVNSGLQRPLIKAFVAEILPGTATSPVSAALTVLQPTPDHRRRLIHGKATRSLATESAQNTHWNFSFAIIAVGIVLILGNHNAYCAGAANARPNAARAAQLLAHARSELKNGLYSSAVRDAEKAVSDGSTGAMNLVGYLYGTGEGVPQDYRLAMR
jgi:hypothetical protein